MSKWKAWEEETRTLHHQIANGNLYCFTMLFSLLYVLRWPSLATPVNCYCYSHICSNCCTYAMQVIAVTAATARMKLLAFLTVTEF